MVDLSGEDAEEERGHEEAHELELFTSNNIDREEREIVTGEETEGCDDDLVDSRSVNHRCLILNTHISGGNSEQLVPGISGASSEADIGKHDALVQL